MPKKVNKDYKEKLFEQEFGSNKEDENSRRTLEMMLFFVGALVIFGLIIILKVMMYNRTMR